MLGLQLIVVLLLIVIVVLFHTASRKSQRQQLAYNVLHARCSILQYCHLYRQPYPHSLQGLRSFSSAVPIFIDNPYTLASQDVVDLGENAEIPATFERGRVVYSYHERPHGDGSTDTWFILGTYDHAGKLALEESAHYATGPSRTPASA